MECVPRRRESLNSVAVEIATISGSRNRTIGEPADGNIHQTIDYGLRRRSTNRLRTSIANTRYAPIIFDHIPSIVLYCVCFYFFFSCSVTLMTQFFKYDTAVLIQYEAMGAVRFPAFTVCGCCASEIVPQHSRDRWTQTTQNEMSLYASRSIIDIMENGSFTREMLIRSCRYVADARRPNRWQRCDEIGAVVESMHDGRKCFTYLSVLHEGRRFVTPIDGIDDDDNRKIKNQNYGNTSYISVQIDFTQTLGIQSGRLKNALNDAVLFSIHPAQMIPSYLDVEFVQLDPGIKYELHFGRLRTELLEAPYITNCRTYDTDKKPRSQNECINLCLIERSYVDSGNLSCINYYSLVTRSWLREHAAHFNPANVQYCAERNNRTFARFIQLRRDCQLACEQPDCHGERYEAVMEDSVIDVTLTQQNVDHAIVTIFPDRKQYEMVRHSPEINFFELIGYLGGHAHIFLGLSAVQLYDVVSLTFDRLRRFYLYLFF